MQSAREGEEKCPDNTCLRYSSISNIRVPIDAVFLRQKSLLCVLATQVIRVVRLQQLLLPYPTRVFWLEICQWTDSIAIRCLTAASSAGRHDLPGLTNTRVGQTQLRCCIGLALYVHVVLRYNRHITPNFWLSSPAAVSGYWVSFLLQLAARSM